MTGSSGRFNNFEWSQPIVMRESHGFSDPEIRVSRVIDHIFSHPDQELSRRSLSELAHYSPEHLPKLFKQIVGETPKQFSLQLRLETAFHNLIVHSHKPVYEIGLECGFSTLSAFSRAMKGYFGHSPEHIRRLPHSQQVRLLHRSASPPLPGGTGPRDFPEIRIVRQPTIGGIYILAPFNAAEKITETFQRLRHTLSATINQPFYGILMPHLRNAYRAFLPKSAEDSRNLPFPAGRIQGGTYACFDITGDLRQTNKAAHFFYRRWLPASGYKITGIAGFETFTGDPASSAYHQLVRHIHIPVGPA
jgi:AraC family transcriptional regulator